MKKWFLPALICLLLAAAHLIGPYPMTMTALVLFLLSLGFALYGVLSQKPTARRKFFLAWLSIFMSLGVTGLMAEMNLTDEAGRTDSAAACTAEYGVVLGAGVREDGQPSRIMNQRLAAAQEFLAENPRAILILSGSQGPGEPVSEAKCMFDALVSRGVDPSRLLLEEDSGDTRENLQNSLRIIAARGGTDAPLAIITSEFHLRRALFLSESLGQPAVPVAAHTDQWYFRVNYTLREVFALLKDRLTAH